MIMPCYVGLIKLPAKLALLLSTHYRGRVDEEIVEYRIYI